MKIIKILRITGMVVLILVVALVILFHLFGSKAIKIGIELGGTHALKVPVTVGDVSLSILAGKADVKNLIVDNPPGYHNPRLLELGNAQIDLDMRSVLSQTINIDDILLENITVVLEQKGLTNNIQQILDGMSSQPSEPQVEEGKPSKKLLIRNLQINEIAVKVKLLPWPGKEDTLTLKLKPITMTDLGTDDKMDMAKLSSKILLAIVSGIAEQGMGILPNDILGPMNDTLESLGSVAKVAIEEVEKILKEGQQATEKILEDTRKVGEDLKKGLDDIFKPKDKDKK